MLSSVVRWLSGSGTLLSLSLAVLWKILGLKLSEDTLARVNVTTYVSDSRFLPNAVNMLVGTHSPTLMEGMPSDGNTLPQVKRPWGFNDWVPQTGFCDPWFFEPSEKTFHGLRCTHQPSPWLGDYGEFRFAPHLRHDPQLTYDADNSTYRPYMFATSVREHEVPGPISLEFAPTSRAAAVRLTYPVHAVEKFLSFYVKSGNLVQTGTGIEGWSDIRKTSVPKHMKLYLVVRIVTGKIVSETSDDSNVDVCESPHDEAEASEGWSSLQTCGSKCSDLRLTIQFTNEPDATVDLHIGTSLISLEQAYRNLDLEVRAEPFEAVMHGGLQEWQQAMARVDVETLGETQRRLFYTNLWKSMLFPRHAHEFNVHDEEVHFSPYNGKTEHGKLVTDSGFWDAYHTVYPMLSLLFPDAYLTTIRGWVSAFQESGRLPEWASPGHESIMSGTFADVVLADAIVKCMHVQSLDCAGINISLAYKAIAKNAFHEPLDGIGRVGFSGYVQHGFVAQEVASDSAALSLGYYVADAAIARAAKAMGAKESAEILERRSRSYHELFNSSSKFFQPRMADGVFAPDFLPERFADGFTEASAFQFRFYVPHDVQGLQALFNGELCEQIEATLLEEAMVLPPSAIAHEVVEAWTISKRFGQYAHNNQPAHEMLWIAKKAGCNDLADEFLRRVLDELYTLDGYSGDEDNGEMAAWYVLASLGLYQLEHGSLEIVLGSPAVVRASIVLPGDRTLRIITENQSRDNVSVKRVWWTPATGPQIEIKDNRLKLDELYQGGELRFVMGVLTSPHGELHDEPLKYGLESER